MKWTRRKPARMCSTPTANTTCSSAIAAAATTAVGRTATASGTHRARTSIDWTRDDAKAGIDVSDEGWDAEMISYPHVFELDGKTYLAYLGDQVGRFGFGLAIAGRTGWVTAGHEVAEARQDFRSVAARAAERLRRVRTVAASARVRRLRADLLLDPRGRRAQRASTSVMSPSSIFAKTCAASCASRIVPSSRSAISAASTSTASSR